MSVVQKMVWVSTVVAHQAVQRRTIALPVVPAQLVGSLLVQIEVCHQVLRHGAVNVRENECAGIVQGVIEVKNPDLPSALHLVAITWPESWCRRLHR